jgi:hypothetical protein
MPNPFDWDYLTTPPASDDILDAWTIIFLAVFLVGFVVAAYVYYRPWTRPFGRIFRRRAVMKWCNIAMWIFGAGLFFFLIRLLQINPLTFGEPIWLWLSFLAALALLAWVGYAATRQPPLLTERGHQGHVRQSAPRAQPVRRPVRRDKSHR